MFGELSDYVRAVADKHAIPALSLSIWNDGVSRSAACGILNVNTHVEATCDSVFQIGSISKVFTACLAIQLVETGNLDLDRPIVQYMPGFHVAAAKATASITARHLLSHTSGLSSDLTFEVDKDASHLIERYVDRCYLLPQVHEDIGRRFSYSNAAYVILGRLIEIVSGRSWWRAVEGSILKPLEMTHSFVHPVDAPRFRVAIGHVLQGARTSVTAQPVASCYMPLAMAPAGAALTMSAADLVKFGRAHLDRDKTGWMSEGAIESMQESQVALPAPTLLYEERWGLGWGLSSWRGVRAFGHGGGTIGQQSLLQIYPEANAVLAVQLNGMTFGGAPVLQEVLADALSQLTRQPAPSMDVAKSEARALTPFVGQFGSVGFRFKIEGHDGELRGQIEVDSGGSLPTQSFSLARVSDNTFEARTPGGIRLDILTFLDPDAQGIPQTLFSGYRLHRRVS